MRLFVAAYPSAEAVASLAAAAPELPPQWRPAAPAHWHLTLAFLGEVAEERLSELQPRLARAAGRSAPLRAAFTGAGAFPSVRRARVFWVGVSGDRAAVVRLAERVTAAARRSGVDVPAGRHRPHLTLARSRAAGGDDASGLVAALASYAGPLWPVEEVVLVRSVLGAAPRHERLAGFALGAAPPVG